MIDLIKQAAPYAIPGTYVLFHSWFTYPKTLIRILELKLHTIAMVKPMSKGFYGNNDKKLNLKSLYATLKKKRGKAKIKASVIVKIGIDSKATPLK